MHNEGEMHLHVTIFISPLGCTFFCAFVWFFFLFFFCWYIRLLTVIIPLRQHLLTSSSSTPSPSSSSSSSPSSPPCYFTSFLTLFHRRLTSTPILEPSEELRFQSISLLSFLIKS